MNFENTSEFARRLDQEDPLASFRERFFIPQVNGRDSLYFTGNSLGLQPRTVADCVREELDNWAQLGVEAHFAARHPWMTYHEQFAAPLAAITGALPEEVVAMNQLTVNLHFLMVSFYQPTTTRFKIICEAKAFPSDQYALQSQVRLHGFEPNQAIIEVHPREGEHTLRTEDILTLIHEHGDTVALVLFGGVNYYSGQFYNLPAITNAAHQIGAMAGFDLAHAAGNVELKLHEWNVDFACWCSYKYLNSGPGGVAGAFIHQQHISNSKLQRLAGWWGHNKATRFRMEPEFDPIPTAEGWQLSNAPVLSMAAHRASLAIFMEAGMDRLHAKRNLLANYLRFVLDDVLKDTSVVLITPASSADRGCQVSMLMDKNGKKIFDELTARGVIADWREPNVIRIAPVPLYNSFADVWEFGNHLQQLLSR